MTFWQSTVFVFQYIQGDGVTWIDLVDWENSNPLIVSFRLVLMTMRTVLHWSWDSHVHHHHHHYRYRCRRSSCPCGVAWFGNNRGPGHSRFHRQRIFLASHCHRYDHHKRCFVWSKTSMVFTKMVKWKLRESQIQSFNCIIESTIQPGIWRHFWFFMEVRK